MFLLCLPFSCNLLTAQSVTLAFTGSTGKVSEPEHHGSATVDGSRQSVG